MIHPIPNGTRDVLPDEMRELRAITEAMRGVFEQRGYGEVWTPTIEFEEVLRRGETGVDPAYRVFLFGSRAEGTAHERSDIDIGIDGPAPVPAAVMAQIREELEEAPTLYTVEVVDFARVTDNFKAVARHRVPL